MIFKVRGNGEYTRYRIRVFRSFGTNKYLCINVLEDGFEVHVVHKCPNHLRGWKDMAPKHFKDILEGAGISMEGLLQRIREASRDDRMFWGDGK